MTPGQIVFQADACRDYGITESKYNEYKQKIEKECHQSCICKIKDIPEYCSIFQTKIEQILTIEQG